MSRERITAAAGLVLMAGVFLGVGMNGVGVPVVFGVRGEFLLFALALAGVALLHHHTLAVALVGAGSILLLKFAFVESFHLADHLHHEWEVLLNLL